MAETISNLGFDPTRVGFALRMALAACVALLASWLLGMEHPGLCRELGDGLIRRRPERRRQ